MGEKPFTDFFDPEVQRIASEDGCSIYKMKNATGEGVITRYEILPGIELFYNDFHMSDGQNQNKIPHPDVLEINHCREGRFECIFSSGDYQYVGAGDLAINHLTNETSSTYFPLSHYHGISITIDLYKAKQTLNQIESVIGGLNIDIFNLADKFCKNDSCLVLRSQREIEHIFSELYCVSPKMIAYYLKVKVLELLMFLNHMSVDDCQKERRYFARNQVQIIKQIQAYMTANLKRHYTLQELSDKFKIPLTTMKICFKGVYGSSVYAYMKSYRMQAATILLRDTSDSITEIAAKMGYDNPSKFSEVFKKEVGELPSEFRKKLSK
ncbi:helix-turn-helix domain-containing protein [Clostridium sp. Marseille-P2415]|uniref:helix-turn-helix domain-containing protein n=1 Tax=Clostridium sp. Marseille-P2415 TaxID=1805471 RepID=UPI0009884CBA|nr:AraC family transcriptional regulator [Clostridium sp. Marseille-P2415]